VTRALLCSLASIAALSVAPGRATAQTLSPELQKLDVSIGRWVFHGTQQPARGGAPQPFTWNEDCQWSPNRLFLECTFSNDWNGRKVESLVVDAYNAVDHSYWHYELYATGQKGNSPFVARMDVTGDTWTEYGRDAIPGKQTGERIIYTWTSPGHVTVVIETSKDGETWTTVDRAEGVRQR
jgi:hypothetical protein